MTVCTCFLVWAGWFKSTEEALAVCLNRRGLSPDVMLPSQLRYIRYFDSIMQGIHPTGDSLRLTRITIPMIPDMENGSCSPFIEVYNKNCLVFSSYRKGSKSRGTVTPVNASDTIVFKLDVVVQGNVFIRCRHLGTSSTSTIFRTQFHTGFVQLFKIDFDPTELDASISYFVPFICYCSLPQKLRFQCDFLPVEGTSTSEMEDIESELCKENSVLWSEVMRKKEERTGTVESIEIPKMGEVVEQPEGVAEVQLEGKNSNLSDAAQDLETMLKTYGSDLNSIY